MANGSPPRAIVRHLPIDKIKPNNWNPNEVDKKTMAKLEADIKKKGFIPPIVVRQVGVNEWEIVDGEHRWTVCKNLGHTTIPAIEANMDDTEAKLKTVQLNYLRGAAVPVRMANLVHDLNKTMTLEDIEAALPYEKVELQDSLALLKLPQDLDRQVAERAAKEKAAEPTFISAVIYKDKAKGIHEFIEQALLESEATFADIRVKIECPAGDHDLVFEAIQNLAKLDRSQNDLKGENAPVVLRFALFPDQAHIVGEAIAHIVYTQGYIKNPRGLALEMMAADYLAGAVLEAQHEPEWRGEESEGNPVPPGADSGSDGKAQEDHASQICEEVDPRSDSPGA